MNTNRFIELSVTTIALFCVGSLAHAQGRTGSLRDRTPQQAAAELIASMRTFKPTKSVVAPMCLYRTNLFTAKERYSIADGQKADILDVAAVVAGSKPSAWVHSQMFSTEVGNELLRLAKNRGLAVNTCRMPSSQDDYLVGKQDAVEKLKGGICQLWKSGATKEQKKLAHVTIGQALGYPKEAIDEYIMLQ
jgi:hypothetical protein